MKNRKHGRKTQFSQESLWRTGEDDSPQKNIWEVNSYLIQV